MRRLLVVLALLLAGCGGDDAPAAQVEETDTEAEHHAALLTEIEEANAEVHRLEGELEDATDRISTSLDRSLPLLLGRFGKGPEALLKLGHELLCGVTPQPLK